MLELTLNFIAKPSILWDSGDLKQRQTVLKLAFSSPPVYDRSSGFRTPKTSMIFKVLDQLNGRKKVMAVSEKVGSNSIKASKSADQLQSRLKIDQLHTSQFEDEAPQGLDFELNGMAETKG